MSHTISIILITFAMFSISGWYFLFNGLRNLRKKRQRDEEETSRATGTIVDYVPVKGTQGKDGKTYYWNPVVEFRVYESVTRQTYTNSMDRNKHPVGESVEVYYSTDDPGRFHLAEDEAYTNGPRRMIRIGIIWILLCAVLVLCFAVFEGGASLRGIWLELRFLIRRLWRQMFR